MLTVSKNKFSMGIGDLQSHTLRCNICGALFSTMSINPIGSEPIVPYTGIPFAQTTRYVKYALQCMELNHKKSNLTLVSSEELEGLIRKEEEHLDWRYN